MPLTPLHLAAGLPLRDKISLKAFILVNVLIDLEVAVVMFFGMDNQGYPLHQWFHTLGGVTALVVVTLAMGSMTKNYKAWFYGTVWGAYSHLFLDALVHWDVEPFEPFKPGNPLYLGLYQEVSLVCALVLVYYLALWVRSLRVGEVVPAAFHRTWRHFFTRTPGE